MKKLLKNNIIQCLILLIFVLLLHISLGYKLRFFMFLLLLHFFYAYQGILKKSILLV